MLNQVLCEIENARGPITVSELGRKMEIEPAALEGMIQFWVQKGRLQIQADEREGDNCSCGPGASNCAPVLVRACAQIPNVYTIQK